MYHYLDSDGVPCIKTIWGKNGTRMGCVLGSVGFDIAIHTFVYKPLAILHPNVDFKALTDDLPPSVKAPPRGASRQEWEDHYDYIATLFKDYDRLANPIGLFRHKDKCKVLLPPWAPVPASLTRNNGITLHLVWDGIILAGAPIGTDEFIHKHTKAKLCALKRKVDAMVNLAKHEAHISYQMVVHCANHAWRYYVRVTPPSLILDLIHEYDTMIINAVMTCLQPQGMILHSTSEARLQRAETMLRLPPSLRGGGAIALATIAPIAYLAATLAVGHGPGALDQSHRDLLERHATSQYDTLCSQIGHPDGIPLNSPALLVLPPQAYMLSHGPFVRSNNETKKRHKAQAIVTSIICTRFAQALERHCASEDNINQHLSYSDAVWTMSALQGGETYRIFHSPLTIAANRMDAGEFIRAARSWATLPQGHIHPDATMAPGTDYVTDWCRVAHRTELKQGIMIDINGNHAVQCKNTVGACIRGHNSLRNGIATLARVARLDADCEPSATKMFMQEIDSANLRYYLPKNATKKNSKAFLDALYNAGNYHLTLAERLEGLMEVQRPTPAPNTIARAHAHHHNEEGEDAEHGGRRLDLSLTSPYTNEVVGDVSRIHPSTAARVLQSYTYFSTLIAARDEAVRTGVSIPTRHDSTPAIRQAAALKREKYYPMIAICEDQKRRKRRAAVPELLALLFDHSGQMSADVYKCIEFMAQHKGRHLSQQEIDEGINSKMATASFRALAKDRLATINAAQWASQIKASYMFPRDSWLAETQLNRNRDYSAVVDRGIPYMGDDIGDVQLVE
jgi:hypothetical protein